jgi:hypothetical protein
MPHLWLVVDPPPPSPLAGDAERTIGPEGFIDESTLPHIVSLLKENSCRAAKKAKEWKREAWLQEELLDAMDSDDNYDF